MLPMKYIDIETKIHISICLNNENIQKKYIRDIKKNIKEVPTSRIHMSWAMKASNVLIPHKKDWIYPHGLQKRILVLLLEDAYPHKNTMVWLDGIQQTWTIMSHMDEVHILIQLEMQDSCMDANNFECKVTDPITHQPGRDFFRDVNMALYSSPRKYIDKMVKWY